MGLLVFQKPYPIIVYTVVNEGPHLPPPPPARLPRVGNTIVGVSGTAVKSNVASFDILNVELSRVVV